MELIPEPGLWEDGLSPYARLDRRLRALGRPGLDAAASSRVVQDAMFDLMECEPPLSPEERAAWDELRLGERRLLVDFWMYEVPAETEASLDAEPAAQWPPTPAVDPATLLPSALDLSSGLSGPVEAGRTRTDIGPSSSPRDLGVVELPLLGLDPRELLEVVGHV